MNKVEIARRLRDLESEIGCFREDLEHELAWDTAKARIDRAEKIEIPKTEPLTMEKAMKNVENMKRTEDGGYVFYDYEAACVEQVELFIRDGGQMYVVRLRFDDDSTERLGDFEQYATAYDFAKEQARRYHIPIFDSTWEDLVD